MRNHAWVAEHTESVNWVYIHTGAEQGAQRSGRQSEETSMHRKVE